jgi:hypothetical protein
MNWFLDSYTWPPLGSINTFRQNPRSSPVFLSKQNFSHLPSTKSIQSVLKLEIIKTSWTIKCSTCPAAWPCNGPVYYAHSPCRLLAPSPWITSNKALPEFTKTHERHVCTVHWSVGPACKIRQRVWQLTGVAQTAGQ